MEFCARMNIDSGRYVSYDGRIYGIYQTQDVEAIFLKVSTKNALFQVLVSLLSIIQCLFNMNCHAKQAKNHVP